MLSEDKKTNGLRWQFDSQVKRSVNELVYVCFPRLYVAASEYFGKNDSCRRVSCGVLLVVSTRVLKLR